MIVVGDGVVVAVAAVGPLDVAASTFDRHNSNGPLLRDSDSNRFRFRSHIGFHSDALRRIVQQRRHDDGCSRSIVISVVHGPTVAFAASYAMCHVSAYHRRPHQLYRMHSSCWPNSLSTLDSVSVCPEINTIRMRKANSACLFLCC